MQVSDYVPILYKNNLEMNNIINSEEQELENRLKPSVDEVFKNTFITTANLKGIQQYEKIFEIQPDIYNETIEFRRTRIITRLTNNIPYSEKYLVNRLNEILGEGNWTYTISYNNYTLAITSIIPGRSWLNELNNFLDRIIPCNIAYTVTVYAATWDLVKQHFTKWNDIYNEEMTWQELMDAEWLT